MLQRLLIQNYAIIEQVEIHFHAGLNIITGETGAGKSILLGALGLIMGKRADTKALLHPEQKCVVEGTFQVSEGYRGFFEEHDIDFDPETHIRREISPSGKSRAFINDTPTRLSLLKTLTTALVDLHQQFDTLDIHHVSFQLNVVDALAGHKEAVQTYRKGYTAYHQDQKRLQSLLQQNQESAKEVDFLEFQLGEFHEATLMPGEDVQAEAELQSLTHAEDIQRILGECQRYITEHEGALADQLKNIAISLNDISPYATEVQRFRERIDGLAFDLEDLAGEMEAFAQKTEYDPARIQEIRERLDIIYRLQNKHQATSVEELLGIQASLSQQLEAFGDLSGQIAELEAAIAAQEKQLQGQAHSISQQRKSVIPDFEQRISEALRLLSMPYAKLQVRVSESENLTRDGIDEVEFLFAANKGGRAEPIRDVASGGELSRLTLCVKSLVAGALALPTMIFDEIDTGVSGDVALKMGGILKQLAQGHQIITITHTPQIAVQADSHFFVYKDHEGEKTKTGVRQLGHEARIHEVATMLSGNPPSPNALENARELLRL